MNDKLDNLIANQTAFEKRLGDFDTRISELTETAEFNANTILEHKHTTTALEKAPYDATRELKAAKLLISELHIKTNISERHSQSFNERLLCMNEVDGESCIKNNLCSLIEQRFQYFSMSNPSIFRPSET